MLLSEILEMFSDMFYIYVYSCDGKLMACYDGRNSIPYGLGCCEVMTALVDARVFNIDVRMVGNACELHDAAGLYE